MEWVLVSLMWLFAIFTIFIAASIAVGVVYLIYLVSKLFRNTDPYDLGEDP